MTNQDSNYEHPSLTKPDWNIFRAKFSGRHQDTFEWLCYLLFCNEFGQKTGIFRYKNQSGIETDPIQIGDEVIGWQAKFYDVALSNHKQDILDTLDTARRDYPNLTKLIFYTNSYWGQGRNGEEPVAKKAAKEKASALSIELEWRVDSYFDSPFVAQDNQQIAKHFFTNSDGVYELLESWNGHTEHLLQEIRTGIDYKGQRIEIDTSRNLAEIHACSDHAIIISGEGGVGKTALVKRFYLKLSEPNSVFYLHKASEFTSTRLRDFLSGVSLSDFFAAHKGAETKIVVIDSAEHLLGLDEIDALKEYVSALFKNGWTVWLTTRNSFVEDLRFQFLEVYRVAFKSIELSPLVKDELVALGDQHGFNLPNDEQLIGLISTPFYLAEYLNHHENSNAQDYEKFKASLWPSVITKNQPQRERLFTAVAVHRAKSRKFFVAFDLSIASQQIWNNLQKEGILGYESPHGYFITHDIYEEWALEQYLESKYLACESVEDFFSEIGDALPIRRAFRVWLSSKLALQDQEFISFVQEVVSSDEISCVWADEIIVSVLLSQNSDFFFQSNKKRILEDDCSFLRRMCLLCRLTCKELDESIFGKAGLIKADFLPIELILTRPRGHGWQALIQFIFENQESIGRKNFYFILPLINDWNRSNQTGSTTRQSSLIALSHYEWLVQESTWIRSDTFEKNLLHTILLGASEIPEELSELIDRIVHNKWQKHRDPYSGFGEFILSKMECANVAAALPQKVIELAWLFWVYAPSDEDRYDYHTGVDHYFGLAHDFQTYYPASAYQTPTSALLNADLYLTLDFIIEFTNQAALTYSNASLDQGGVETVELTLNDGAKIEQVISHRLWCLYRGSDVNSHILESIHMALEKFLLERGVNTPNETLNNVLQLLLSKSSSASLTAIVTSVVNALPEKTFDTAKILFRSRKLFRYDMARCFREQSHKSTITSLKGFNPDPIKSLHEEERIKACDDKHRKNHLETTMLNYQLFRDESVGEEEASSHIETLNEILDEHYKALPALSEQTEEDKIWRICLARIDRRGMNPTTEKVEGGIQVNLNPKLDDDLKEISESSESETAKAYKYLPLHNWADDKLAGRQQYKGYQTYEDNPISALHEVRELWFSLQKGEISTNPMYYFDRSLPAIVATVLLRDFREQVKDDDLLLCKNIVFAYSSLFLAPEYSYQVPDGVLPCLLVLPSLMKEFPEQKNEIKKLLIFALMENHSTGLMGGDSFNSIVIKGIQRMWSEDFDCAQSIYLGYLILAPLKKSMLEAYRQEQWALNNYELDYKEFQESYFNAASQTLELVADESITHDMVADVKSLDSETMSTAFQLISLRTEHEIEPPLSKEIALLFSEKVLSDDRKDKVDYLTKHSFLKRLAMFLLHLPTDAGEIEEYLQPFLNQFLASDAVAELIRELVLAQNEANRLENFWYIWELLRVQVVETNKNSAYWKSSEIIKAYMLVSPFWKKDASEWHSLGDDRKDFFRNLTLELGANSSYLYSLTKLVCGLGSRYLNDAIGWIASAIKNNDIELSKDDRDNVIFYLEKAIRKYIYCNRQRVRQSAKAKLAVMTILDFLVENDSTLGYMLREDIA